MTQIPEVRKLKEIIGEDRPITYGILKPGPDVEGGVPYVRVLDMENGTVKANDVRRTTEAIAHQYARSSLKEGDILLSIRGHVGRVAMVPAQLEGANITQDTARLAVNGACHPRYLFWYLQTPDVQNWMRSRTKGVAVKGINLGDVKELEVPLVESECQGRIADILDKADSIRHKRKEGVRLTEELLRSTFLEMFGDPAMNPKGWPIRVMGEVVKETQYGTSEKSNSDGKGIPVLRMNNITYGGDIDLSDIKWSEIRDSDLEQLTVKRGDLLFNRTNSPELVGKTAVWDRDKPYAYAGYLFRVRFHEKIVLPDYISAFLNSAYGKKMLFAKAKPSNNMSNFSAGEFCRIELPVPEIGLQRRFASVVAEVKKLKEKRLAGLKDATDLFGSLVQRAFQGAL